MHKHSIAVVLIACCATTAFAGFGDFLKKTADVAVAVDQAVSNDSAATPAAAPAAPAAPATPAATPAPAGESEGTVERVVSVLTAEPEIDDGAAAGIVNDITMHELHKRYKAKTARVIIDVRSRGEYKGGHIPHAKNIPVDQIAAKIGTVVPNKNTAVYLYCRSGARAESAGNTLVNLGYQRVYNAGGIGSWPGRIEDK